MTRGQTLLALDIGTSRCRATVFSADGTVVADASRPMIVETPAPGEVVLDPEGLWSDIGAIIRDLGPAAAGVGGVGITAMLGMLPIDRDRRPLGPVLLWSDRRAEVEAAELAATGGRESLAIAARRLMAELTGPRLKWLARHQPDLFRRIDRVVSLKDFVLMRMTGALVTDETHASYSGLFDVDSRAWSAVLCRLQEVEPERLPPVHAATDVAGTVTEMAADATGLRAGIPVAVGSSDGTVGAIGAGAVRAGVTIDVAGTTDVILHVAAAPVRDPDGAAIVNAHAAPGLWTVGGPTGLTGGAVDWMARILGYASVGEAAAALRDELAAFPPGDGPVFQPALTGSRFPDWNAAEQGMLLGLSHEHGSAALLRAAREGAAFTVRAALSVVQRCGMGIDAIIVVGGLARDADALQQRADILDLPLRTLANCEASAVGAAMLAGVAVGMFADLGEAAAAMVRYDRTFVPDAGRAAAYEGPYQAWCRAFGPGRWLRRKPEAR